MSWTFPVATNPRTSGIIVILGRIKKLDQRKFIYKAFEPWGEWGCQRWRSFSHIWERTEEEGMWKSELSWLRYGYD